VRVPATLPDTTDARASLGSPVPIDPRIRHARVERPGEDQMTIVAADGEGGEPPTDVTRPAHLDIANLRRPGATLRAFHRLGASAGLAGM
jgi:hypothetical protein